MNTTLNPGIELSWSGANRVVRRLGGGVEPVRRLYFLDFPLLLLSVGLLTWMVPTDTMLFLSALTGAAVGLYTLWEIAIRRKPIQFSHVFCISNTVGYGLGVVNSWLSISRGNLGLAQFFNRDPEAVSHAMAAVLIASSLLYSLGEIFETPIFGKNFQLALDNRAGSFVFIGTGLVIAGYVMGDLGYMGSNASANGGHVSLISGTLGWLFPILFAFTALCSVEWSKGMVKRFFFAMLALQFVLIIPTGRRNILYFVLLGIIASRFGSFKPKWSLSKRVVIAAVLASVIGLGATAFYYLRFASWSRHQVSLIDRISLAIALYESGNTAKVNQSFKENLQKRTFVLGYVSDLLDASFRIESAKGQNALHEFQLVIPSALWEDKGAFLYSEESIANTTYHFAYRDEANSVYSAGAIDFGLWGMIVYPIIISGLFRVVAEFVRLSFPEVVATLVILLLVYNALTTEAGLWVRFLAIRDALFSSVLLWMIFKIPAFSFASQPEKGVLSR
ncbi:hypothetical protein H7849_07820 [Alloacidobacterium dinghuense]|uniref:O-antigen polysaccharide polymerase Wzy n=1 Tax=Alloacidobacterium dinghuense TaxID=2763107 RepID=A0A7G8BMP3_9BACT|nr:hypothetical protein [Alloacidobacterium dinghuense]QNI33813.1 hypothetical protein H7849_07820 [Alloacidobacterium dinghuense]